MLKKNRQLRRSNMTTLRDLIRTDIKLFFSHYYIEADSEELLGEIMETIKAEKLLAQLR